MTAAENFLTAILGCGADDLSMLENVGYSWEDILSQMDFPDRYQFNDVIRTVTDLGIIDIKDWIEARLQEPDISDDERTALKSLNPDADIEAYCNYLATYVSFKGRANVYRKYCADALEHFRDMTGLVING